VQIQLKRGHYHNEFTRFRYDVTLHVGTEVSPTKQIQWLDWQEQQLTLPEVRRLLSETEPEMLGLRGVPNARILTEVKTLSWLASNDGSATVSEWREVLSQQLQDSGVDPEDLWAISREYPYSIEMSWFRPSADGGYDVVFQHRRAAEAPRFQVWTDVEDMQQPKPWRYYTNQPLQENFSRKVVSQIRSALEEQLPDYMVPSAIVMLDALPLTPNGKVDRKALPAPDQTRIELEGEFVAPRTPVEEVLAGIWAEVLSVERVGVFDNFFQLGGHSLLATQIIGRVRNAFQVELPLRSLFESPTVAGLVQAMETARLEAQVLPSVPIQKASRSGDLPLSFSQQSFWSRAQLIPDAPFLNTAVTVRFQGALNVQALSQSLNEIVRRHEVWRTTFTRVDGQPVQVIHPELTLKLEVVNLQGLPETDREAEALRLAAQEVRQTFDLSTGPLLRATLMQLCEMDHRLFLTIHHIICDGYSIQNIFFKELVVLYEAFCAGQPSPLPELAFQYVDYTVWQRHWLQGEVIKPHLAYWKQQLAGMLPLQLPYDHPRPVVKTFQSARQYVALSKSLSEKLKALSQREGVTLFMTLLAAYQTLLYRYSGSDDIPVVTFTAGSNRPEFQGLLGCFVNVLVLYTHLDGNASFKTLLQRVREVTLEAYSHQDLPFEILLDEVQPDLFAGQDCAFQAVFVLDSHRPNLDEKWTISWMDVDNGAANRDLSLELQERPEGLFGLFQYSAELFDASTIERMVEHFQTLLENIVANPGENLSYHVRHITYDIEFLGFLLL
jgi:acyl carrier protein